MVSDLYKTGIFVGTALVSVVLAAIAMTSGRSSREVVDAMDPLFPDFESAEVATSMEILAFDAQKGKLHRFKVAKKEKTWVIPSHADYPVDAADQLAAAATSLIGLKRGASVSDKKEDHATYGVLEPNESLAPGEEGVGMLVIFKGEDDKTLAEIIIGKKVGGEAQSDPTNPHANATSNQSDLRYVRIREGDRILDRVYRAKIDSNKFSTNFADWIEQDLLKLKFAWKIQRIIINDYDLIDQGLGFAMDQQDLIEIIYNAQGGDDAWSLVDAPIGAELDVEKLNELRNALRDLKIVDVSSAQGRSALENAGFYPYRNRLLSRDGEIIVELEGGIVYTLLFGKIAPKTLGQQTDKAKAKEDEDDDKNGEKKEDESGEDVAEATGDNRYLFVYARVDTNLIGEPDIKPLPRKSHLGPLSNDDEAKTEKQADPKKAKDSEAGSQPDLSEDEPSPRDVVRELMLLDEENLLTKPEYERKLQEVEDHNDQQMEEKESQLEDAQKGVDELNGRFLAWYYVIDNAMYKKFHLTRKDIVKAKEEPKKETNKDSNKKTDKDTNKKTGK